MAEKKKTRYEEWLESDEAKEALAKPLTIGDVASLYADEVMKSGMATVIRRLRKDGRKVID